MALITYTILLIPYPFYVFLCEFMCILIHLLSYCVCHCIIGCTYQCLLLQWPFFSTNQFYLNVKVDDTVDGIREGLSAGCWTVGVTKTV